MELKFLQNVDGEIEPASISKKMLRVFFFQKVSKELESLKTKNNEENFYEVFKGQFGNKKDLDNFLEYQEKTLKNFTSDEIFIKNTNTKIVKIAKY